MQFTVPASPPSWPHVRRGPLVNDKGKVEWTRGISAYCLSQDVEGGLSWSHTLVPLDAMWVYCFFRVAHQGQLAGAAGRSAFLRQVALQTPLQVWRASESCAPGRSAPPCSLA